MKNRIVSLILVLCMISTSIFSVPGFAVDTIDSDGAGVPPTGNPKHTVGDMDQRTEVRQDGTYTVYYEYKMTKAAVYIEPTYKFITKYVESGAPYEGSHTYNGSDTYTEGNKAYNWTYKTVTREVYHPETFKKSTKKEKVWHSREVTETHSVPDYRDEEYTVTETRYKTEIQYRDKEITSTLYHEGHYETKTRWVPGTIKSVIDKKGYYKTEYDPVTMTPKRVWVPATYKNKWIPGYNESYQEWVDPWEETVTKTRSVPVEVSVPYDVEVTKTRRVEYTRTYTTTYTDRWYTWEDKEIDVIDQEAYTETVTEKVYYYEVREMVPEKVKVKDTDGYWEVPEYDWVEMSARKVPKTPTVTTPSGTVTSPTGTVTTPTGTVTSPTGTHTGGGSTGGGSTGENPSDGSDGDLTGNTENKVVLASKLTRYIATLVHYGALPYATYDGMTINESQVTINDDHLTITDMVNGSFSEIVQASSELGSYLSISGANGSLPLTFINKVLVQEPRTMASLKAMLPTTVSSNLYVGRMTLASSMTSYNLNSWNADNEKVLESLLTDVFVSLNNGTKLYKLNALSANNGPALNGVSTNYMSLYLWKQLIDKTRSTVNTSLQASQIASTELLINALVAEGYLAPLYIDKNKLYHYYYHNNKIYVVNTESVVDTAYNQHHVPSVSSDHIIAKYKQLLRDSGLTTSGNLFEASKLKKVSDDYNRAMTNFKMMLRSINTSLDVNRQDMSDSEIIKKYVNNDVDALRNFMVQADVLDTLNQEVASHPGKYPNLPNNFTIAKKAYYRLCIFAGVSNAKLNIGIKEYAALATWYFENNDVEADKAVEALVLFEYLHPTDVAVGTIKVKNGKFVNASGTVMTALMSKWQALESSLLSYSVDIPAPEGAVAGRIESTDFILLRAVINDINRKLSTPPVNLYMVYDGNSKFVDSSRATESKILLNDWMINTSLVSGSEGAVANEKLFNEVKNLKKKYADGTYSLSNLVGELDRHNTTLVGIPTWQIIGDYISNHRNELDDSTKLYDVLLALVDMEYLSNAEFDTLMSASRLSVIDDESLNLVLNKGKTHYDLVRTDGHIEAVGLKNNGAEVIGTLGIEQAMKAFAGDIYQVTRDNNFLVTGNHTNKVFIERLLAEHQSLLQAYQETVGNKLTYDGKIIYHGDKSDFVSMIKERLIELNYYETYAYTKAASLYDQDLESVIKIYKENNKNRHINNIESSTNASKYIGKLSLMKLFNGTSIEGPNSNVDGIFSRLLVLVPNMIKGIAQEFLEEFTFVGVISMVQGVVSFAQAAMDSLGNLFVGLKTYLGQIGEKFGRLFNANETISTSEISELGLIMGTIAGIGLTSIVRPDALVTGVAKLGQFFGAVKSISDDVVDGIKGIAKAQFSSFKSVGKKGIETVQALGSKINDVQSKLKTLLAKLGDYKQGDITRLRALNLDEVETKILINKFISEDRVGYKGELAYLFNMVESNGCLVGETLVHTEDGYRPIRDIQIGDKVLSFDEKTKAVSYKEVYDVFEGVKRDIYWIRTNTSLIKATEEHPFYVEGKGWVEASALSTNDILVDDQMVSQPIVSIKKEVTEGTKIYNLSVVDNHSFYVSRANILTHNENCKNLTEVIKEIFSSNGALKYEALLDEVAKIKNFETSVTNIDKAIEYTQKFPNDSIVRQAGADLISAKTSRSLSAKVLEGNKFDTATVARLKELLDSDKITVDDLKTFKDKIVRDSGVAKDKDAIKAIDDLIKGTSNFKTFSNTVEAENWATDVFSSWKNNLSVDEISAINKYTGDDHYGNINSVLRGLTDEFDAGNAKIVDDLTGALSKSSLPESTTLYRGTSTAMLGDLKNLPIDDMVGGTITEGAFMSSSLSKDVAKQFENGLMLKIEAPAGSKGAFIGNISEYSIEAEVLFDKGQTMIIKEAAEVNGVLELTVEILN